MKSTLLAIAAFGMLPALAEPGNGPYEDPSSAGTVGLFTIPRATTLGAGQFNFGLGVFYETLAREEGGANVERGGLTAAFGLTDRLEVFGSFEPRDGVRRDYLVEDDLGIPHFLAPRLNDHPYAAGNFDHGLGDLRVGAKLKLLGAARDYSGISFGGEVKIPTANKDDGIGTGKLDLGGDLIGSLEAGQTLGLNGHVGLTHKGDPDEFDLADELRWGVGIQLPTRLWLSAIVETYGVHYVSKPDGASRIGFANYRIAQGGVRLSFGNGLALSGGLNWNLSIDDTARAKPEKLGSFVQISLSSRQRATAPAPEPPPPPDPPPAPRASLTCRADVASVRRGESVRVVVEVRNFDSETLKVEWSASQGTVTPATGASVAWSSAGAEAGQTTITATASDAQGAHATCAVHVRVDDPPPPPAPTVRRFTCDEFVAHSARIDNRCKAVLDDVAALLRSNPTATLRITGHDDATGRTRSVAAERAENAKSYLLQTHVISVARSTVATGPELERTVVIELTIP